jgi:flagellin-specific chaperone FliS
MGAGFSHLLDRLLAALRAADAALEDQTMTLARAALDEAFASLGALYAALDSARHPEVTAYLQFVYDECFRSIGAASPQERKGLLTAITVLHQVRLAEERAQSGTWPTESPSLIARRLAV